MIGIFMSSKIRSGGAARVAVIAICPSITERTLYPCSASMCDKRRRLAGVSSTTRMFPLLAGNWLSMFCSSSNQLAAGRKVCLAHQLHQDVKTKVVDQARQGVGERPALGTQACDQVNQDVGVGLGGRLAQFGPPLARQPRQGGRRQQRLFRLGRAG